MPNSKDDQEPLTERLRRIRAVVCPNHKYEDEVERCPCMRGGQDIANNGRGFKTGCKDLQDAINELDANK